MKSPKLRRDFCIHSKRIHRLGIEKRKLPELEHGSRREIRQLDLRDLIADAVTWQNRTEVPHFVRDDT